MTWVDPTKIAVSATSRRIGASRLPAGFSRSGVSRTPSTLMAAVIAYEAIAMPITSQILPASTSGPMRITTKMGSNSKTDFTPDAWPRWCSGTMSGIRPCNAPCATLADACRSATPAIKTRYALLAPALAGPRKDGDAPMMSRKTMLNSAPVAMYGRRRPKRDVLRSLSIPASGCTSIATASPITRTVAR